MRNRITITLFCIIFISVFSITGCQAGTQSVEIDQTKQGNQTHTTISGGTAWIETFNSVDEITYNSQVIVIGTVNGGNSKLSYYGLAYSLTEFKVETVMKGSVAETINILQTVMVQDPLICEGDKMILFLMPTAPPFVSLNNVYYINGCFQGQYKIIEHKLIGYIEGPEGSPLIKDIDKYTIDALTTRINALSN
jgi:hypothetical protein